MAFTTEIVSSQYSKSGRNHPEANHKGRCGWWMPIPWNNQSPVCKRGRLLIKQMKGAGRGVTPGGLVGGVTPGPADLVLSIRSPVFLAKAEWPVSARTVMALVPNESPILQISGCGCSTPWASAIVGI
jgi:hypothetical protein